MCHLHALFHYVLVDRTIKTGFEALLQEQQATRQTIAGIKVGDTVIGQAAERYRNRLDRMHGTGTGWTG